MPHKEIQVGTAEINTNGAHSPSILDKCRAYFHPDGLYARIQSSGLYPYFRPIERNDGTKAIVNGREVIMAGSNNYLGLTSDRRVKEAAKNAIDRYGTGCTGSRFLNGTLDIHKELEARLAKFMEKEECVLFSTGYMTNLGVIQALASRGDIIFSDKDNHACIVAGTQSSRADTWRFRHSDMAHLERLLQKANRENPRAGKFIVTDGVFSMSGKIAEIPALVELSDRYGAALMLDDAHAVGVIGPGGQGSASSFGMLDRVPITTGTFSKSFASLGGFCVGDSEVIGYIRHTSSAHIFSASMPPANVATVLKCLDILESEPERIDRLAEISEYMRNGFQSLGFDILSSESPVIPVVIGHDDHLRVFAFWKDLLEAGVFVNPVVPPAVPPGRSLMRTSYMATHTNSELDFVLDVFDRMGRKHGVIERAGVA